MRSSLASCLTAMALAPLVAQNRLLVPSQFAEIGLAIQAATPGTIIEVEWRLQPYQPFVVDRSVTIVGRGGENTIPRVAVDQGVGVSFQLAAGERATMARIDVDHVTGAPPTQGTVIHGGFVTLEDCRFRADDDPAGSVAQAVVEALATDLTMTFCRIEPGRGYVALRATQSQVAMCKTRCHGGSFPGRAAVQLVDSTLLANDSWLLGGESLFGQAGGTALHLAGVSRAWLTGSIVRGGFGEPGASGIVNLALAPVEHSQTTVVGGIDLSTNLLAPAATGPVSLNANLIGLAFSEPLYRRGTLQPGMAWNVSAIAQPGTPALLLASFAPTTTLVLVTAQPAVVPGELALVIPVMTDATGRATYFDSVPNVPTLIGAGLWMQAVAGNSLPLQASPIGGVVVR